MVLWRGLSFGGVLLSSCYLLSQPVGYRGSVWVRKFGFFSTTFFFATLETGGSAHSLSQSTPLEVPSFWFQLFFFFSISAFLYRASLLKFPLAPFGPRTEGHSPTFHGDGGSFRAFPGGWPAKVFVSMKNLPLCCLAANCSSPQINWGIFFHRPVCKSFPRNRGRHWCPQLHQNVSSNDPFFPLFGLFVPPNLG